MTRLTAWKRNCVLVFAGLAIACSAQSFSNLATFNRTDGWTPSGLLTQGIDGNFYGETIFGGPPCGAEEFGCGNVFKISSSGSLTSLFSFPCKSDCPDGDAPESGVILATNGDFYGTASSGGVNAAGTIFKTTASGHATLVYTFCALANCADGSSPTGGVVQGIDGNFYGTTRDGGNGPLCSSNGYCGNVFKLTPAGALTTIYNFCSQPNCADGILPSTPIIQGADGNFYGTTAGLNAFHSTIFKVTPSGKLTTLYTFSSIIGVSQLFQGNDGNFYGITNQGGANGLGSVFKMTPTGVLTTLYSFCSEPSCLDGADPFGGVVQGTDGNFYGTTSEGGRNGSGTLGGTIYSITSAGALTTLYNFCSQSPNCADGTDPSVPPVQGTDGNFYGSTTGGNVGNGTIYQLATGLGPFVKFLPAAGKVGAEVGILGTALTGATSVAFNGTPAKFSVSSSTLILAHVPAGAKTGSIEVTLPSGTLSSNVPFNVIP